MQFFNWLQPNLLKANVESVIKKYDKPFFIDESIQQEIKKKGYAVRDLLDEQTVRQLYLDFDNIRSHDEFVMGDLFWSSGRSSSTTVRNLSKDSIEKYVKPSLMKFFRPEVVELVGGVFVAKPPSKQSALSPHQDSSHINEDEHISVYAWCALNETNQDNGAVYVLPGSHLFGNIHRSLNIPWQFEPFKESMWEYCTPIPMRAGQVLFFDSATIHCSPPNMTNELRLGVNFFIQPKAAPFTHYYRDDSTPKGMVEKFHVNIDFYYNEDFEARPPAKYKNLGMEKYRDLALSASKLKRMCKAAIEIANK